MLDYVRLFAISNSGGISSVKGSAREIWLRPADFAAYNARSADSQQLLTRATMLGDVAIPIESVGGLEQGGTHGRRKPKAADQPLQLHTTGVRIFP